MTCLVYALTDPDGSVRYVGKSTTGLRRPRGHGSPAHLARNRTWCANWIRSLRAQGKDYGIRVLEDDVAPEALSAAERFWIALARTCGASNLTNLTDGGDGAPGHVKSPEARAKTAAALRGRPRDARTLAAVRASHIGRPLSAETRAKISVALKGREVSEGVRRQQAAAMLATWADPQERGSRAAAMSAAWTPERRARLAAANRARASQKICSTDFGGQYVS